MNKENIKFNQENFEKNLSETINKHLIKLNVSQIIYIMDSFSLQLKLKAIGIRLKYK